MGWRPSSLHLPNQPDFWRNQFCELNSSKQPGSFKLLTRRTRCQSCGCVCVRVCVHVYIHVCACACKCMCVRVFKHNWRREWEGHSEAPSPCHVGQHSSTRGWGLQSHREPASWTGREADLPPASDPSRATCLGDSVGGRSGAGLGQDRHAVRGNEGVFKAPPALPPPFSRMTRQEGMKVGLGAAPSTTACGWPCPSGQLVKTTPRTPGYGARRWPGGGSCTLGPVPPPSVCTACTGLGCSLHLSGPQGGGLGRLA